MKALQKEAQGTFCSLGESKGDTVMLDLIGKVQSTKYALDFLEKVCVPVLLDSSSQV
jgi:hypothetical protein